MRWSTRRGGFLAKAATGVLAAAGVLDGVPPEIAAAAEATLEQSLLAAVDAPHVEVHPLLYTIEGVLSLPEHPRCAAVLPRLAAQFDALLAAARARGGVPESLAPGAGGAAPARFDVLAQALRVGRRLPGAAPAVAPDPTGLAWLRQALVARIKPNGAIPFTTGAGQAQDNVWATMFAEQALSPAGPGGDGPPGRRRRVAAGMSAPASTARAGARRLGHELAAAAATGPAVSRGGRGGPACRAMPARAPRRLPRWREGISVVIPERDAPAMLAEALASVLRALDAVAEPRQVIVVTNGTPGAAYADLERHFPACSSCTPARHSASSPRSSAASRRPATTGRT